MKYSGVAHRFGDNVDTDEIIPARYLTLDRPDQAKHAMEDLNPEFVKRVKPGDVIVAGRNFGAGSARPANRPLVDNGISCVIAASFATLFMRNAVNEGLPVLKCPGAAEGIGDGDRVEVDLETGRILNLSRGTEYQAEPLPEFIPRILPDGGLA